MNALGKTSSHEPVPAWPPRLARTGSVNEGARSATRPPFSEGLPREARLTKPSDFQRVFAKPIVSTDRCFRILARPNQQGRPRLGMAVSRKVDRKASGRNRIKRVVRESFRRCFRDRRPALDFVVLPRPASATICNRRLTESLAVHWRRLAGSAMVAENGNTPDPLANQRGRSGGS